MSLLFTQWEPGTWSWYAPINEGEFDMGCLYSKLQEGTCLTNINLKRAIMILHNDFAPSNISMEEWNTLQTAAKLVMEYYPKRKMFMIGALSRIIMQNPQCKEMCNER